METLIDQIKDRCVHYESPRYNKFCKAGVNYNDHMRIKEFGPTGCLMRLPCTGRTGVTRGIPVEPCNKYQPPTEEAIQAEISYWEKVQSKTIRELANDCKDIKGIR